MWGLSYIYQPHFINYLAPSEKAVAIATGTGEVGDDDFIIVRVDIVVVTALDHLLTALEATAPIEVLVVFIFHRVIRPSLRRAGFCG